MNIEDITEEQRAAWTPRQRQWFAGWKNGNQNCKTALLNSLISEDTPDEDEESTQEQ